MRTNIDIDDDLLAQAMRAGPFTTKKETVEAGLRLLARQVAYREILKWQGKLPWEGDEAIDWTQPDPQSTTWATPAQALQEPPVAYNAKAARTASQASPAKPAPAKPAPTTAARAPKKVLPRAGR